MKVKFVPQNVEFEIKPGQSVMHLAEDNGIYVKSVCRGVPSCAECRVRIVEGEANVFAPVAAELGLIGSGHFIDRRRLACQLQCMGDVTVDMSEQLAKQSGLIGGRKAKAAKALGDRVEDETVIRDSSASGGRSGGRDRDLDAEDENESSEKPSGPRERPREIRNRPANPVTIGGPTPQGAVGPSTAPTGGGGIQPRAPGSAPPSGGPGGNSGGNGNQGGGRSRRSGRRR